MGRTHHPAIAWLIATALLASARALAQAHGPSATEFPDQQEVDTPAGHAAQIADIDTWLRRMTGRFRLSSALNSERPGQLVDCVGVGMGPGVQCVTGRGGNTPKGEEANAAMQLFGLDPLALTISRLAVNARGIAQFSQGKVSGDTLVFPRVNCAIPENIRSNADRRIISCDEILKIRALANGQELQFTTETIQQVWPPSPPPGRARKTGSQFVNYSTTMWMKRVPQDEMMPSPNLKE